MTASADKLATSLEVLKTFQDKGVVAIPSRDMSRTHRERLVGAGYLQEVMKGWYIPAQPSTPQGESTAWFVSYWGFCRDYLESRFPNRWCLTPEQSLLLHVGNWSIPGRLIVRTPDGDNTPRDWPFETSLLAVRVPLPPESDLLLVDGLRIYSLPAALMALPPDFFADHPNEARAALAHISDASELLPALLDEGQTTIAGRLVGAFRNLGRNEIADEIEGAMAAAGHRIRIQDPFATAPALIMEPRSASAPVHRLNLMWQDMRDVVLEHFPAAPGPVQDAKAYLAAAEQLYVQDAYHSLSIEGYQVSEELIERIRQGQWEPDSHQRDSRHRDALAAQGYRLAFLKVQESIRMVIEGQEPGKVAERDHRLWYRELFSPAVKAGLLETRHLAGYRNGPVYIRQSRYVPPRAGMVRDMMPALFRLLLEEPEPAVRAVLGHFFLVFIHPYADGNGRMGRFLMNAMLPAGGYPWLVVPVDRRAEYMATLEAASVRGEVQGFVQFLASLLKGVR